MLAAVEQFLGEEAAEAGGGSGDEPDTGRCFSHFSLLRLLCEW
jgi:hypothetical protein